jgi:hypothetical protein
VFFTLNQLDELPPWRSRFDQTELGQNLRIF